MSDTIPPPPDSSLPQSPFTPTFGTTPPALVGRQEQINDFAYALDNGPGSKGRATFVTGQRGVGKSVMLTVFQEVATTRSWMTVQATASTGFVENLTHARLPEVLKQLDAAKTVTSSTVGANVSILGFGGGITTRSEPTNSLTPDFRHQLMKVLDILDKHGSGLLITLDEVHRSQVRDIQVVADAIAFAFAQRAPVAFVAAGLPETINGLVNDNISTYLRRAERVGLGHLTPAQTRIAIEEPLRKAGRSITPEALDLAVAGSGNYPYLVQLTADEAWRAAAGGDIREGHVHAALDAAQRSMYRQIHEPMIEAVSDRERQYLLAMATDPERSQTSEIARRMQISDQHGSVYRNRLINQGVIEPDGRGYVKFAVPFSRKYLQTQMSHKFAQRIDHEVLKAPSSGPENTGKSESNMAHQEDTPDEPRRGPTL